MHKKVIAAAVAAAVSLPFAAHAQSNVTIYGLIDLNLGHERAGDIRHTGVDHGELARGHAVVAPGQWRLTDRLDASIHVLDALDHDLSRRGAFVAYIGSTYVRPSVALAIAKL